MATVSPNMQAGSRGRHWHIRLAVLLFAVFLSLRWWLFATGRLAGTDLELVANLIVALPATFAIGFALTARRRDSPIVGSANNMTVGEFVGALGAAIGIPALVIGLAQALAPSTPREAEAPACRGVSVAGGKLLTTTGSQGVNGRSGPGTTYPQNRRFGPDCTLSFDGYCIGEPTNDLVVNDLPDQRWLILHRSWLETGETMVAAGKVQAQDAESDLGDKPDKRCSKLGGLPEPSRLMLSSKVQGTTIKAVAASDRALLIGFAIALEDLPRQGGDDKFVQLGTAPKRTDESGRAPVTWDVSVTGKAVGKSTRMTLLAAVCLAPAIPDARNSQTVQVEWDGRRVSLLSSATELGEQDLSRLRAAACRIAPDRPAPQSGK